MTQLERTKDEVVLRIIGAPGSRLRPHEVEKAVSDELGIDLSTVREAVKDLVEDDELAYVYRDPCNYLELAPVRSHHAARPMEVVFDAKGEPWICDAGVEASNDLVKKGCWACGDLAFTRND